MTSSKLEKCPFDGSLPLLEYKRGRFPYMVKCPLCGTSTTTYRSEQLAKEVWNAKVLMLNQSTDKIMAFRKKLP